MATKKKTKTKAKKKKTSSGKVTSRKQVAKKVAAKKKTSSQTKAASKAKRAAARALAPMPPPAVPAVPPGTERIGIVTHYFSHLSVAIVKLENGSLSEGDVIHIKGHTSDFTQRVESMEVDHVQMNEARPGQSFGLRVKEHAREHDVVYKAKP